MNWYILALGSLLLGGVGDFIAAGIRRRKKTMSLFSMNFISYIMISLMGLGIYVGSHFTSNQFLKEYAGTFDRLIFKKPAVVALAGASSMGYVLGNHFIWRAYGTSPNPGLAEAVASLGANGTLLLITTTIFNTHASMANIAGIFLSTVGLALIAM